MGINRNTADITRTAVSKSGGDTILGPLYINKQADGLVLRAGSYSSTNNPRLEISVNEASKNAVLDFTGSATPNVYIQQGGNTRLHVDTNGRIGIGTTADSNYLLNVVDASSTGYKIGNFVTGKSSSGYPSIGYNIRYTSTADTFQYNGVDLASMIYFKSGSITFHTANSGTGGSTISWNAQHTFRADGRVGFNSGGSSDYTFSISSFSNSSGHYAFNVASVSWGANLFSITGDGMMVSSPTYNTFTTSNAANVYVNSSGGFFRSTSSRKYKTQIEDLEPSYAEKLLDFRPVWYRSTCEKDRSDWSWYGFIAEELAEIEPRFVEYKQNEDGTLEPEGVQYSRMVVPLIALVQKQQQQINDLIARVAALENN